MSSSNCCFLTCIQVPQEADQMVWCSHPFQNFPQLTVICTVEGSGTANKAEIDAFLELSCFFYDPVDAGNLISGSAAFSKTSLNMWKFKVHVLLKPGLRSGVAAQRNCPTSKERQLHGCRRAEKSYFHVQGQEGRPEKIPLVRGEGQRLCFAGAAVKRPLVQGERNPSKTVGVARGHQRVNTLKP